MLNNCVECGKNRNWVLNELEYTTCRRWFKPHSARTGRTVFTQISASVVRRKANDGVVCAIRAWLKYNSALSAVV